MKIRRDNTINVQRVFPDTQNRFLVIIPLLINHMEINNLPGRHTDDLRKIYGKYVTIFIPARLTCPNSSRQDHSDSGYHSGTNSVDDG